jgi:O-antigen/teichoic acid export membrane protein
VNDPAPGPSSQLPRPAGGVQETVVRNSALLAVVFVFNTISGLITSSLLTHLLGRDLYGQYGNYFRIYAWLSSLAAFILPPVLVRYVAELLGAGRESLAWRLLRVSLLIQAANLLLIFGGYLAFVLLVDGALPGSWIIVGALLIAAAGQAFGQLTESFLRGFQHFAGVAWANLAGALARVVGYTSLFLAGGSLVGALYLFAGSTFVYLAVTLTIVAILWRRRRRDDAQGVRDSGLRRRVIEYAGTMGIGSLLAMVVWNNVEMFFIASWWDGREGCAAQLAFYTLAITLSALPARVGKTMSGALLPAFSGLYGSGDLDRIRRGFRQATILSTATGAILCTMAAATAQPFIRLFFPDDLLGAALPFQLMLIPVLFMSINHAGSAALPALEGHRYYLGTSIALVPINLALDVWLIPSHGALGAAVVNAVMQSVAILTGLYYTCVIRKVGFPVVPVLLIVASAGVSGFLVYTVSGLLSSRGLPDAVVLLVDSILGLAIYLPMIRLAGVLGAEEKAVLQRCARLLPARLQPACLQVLSLVVGR